LYFVFAPVDTERCEERAVFYFFEIRKIERVIFFPQRFFPSEEDALLICFSID